MGEIGGPYSNPGKQSWSITQGLYAGQVLGEMMNDGVSRLTWWIGFGNCNGTAGNDSASLYGWQDFGAYNVFSDGPSDGDLSGRGSHRHHVSHGARVPALQQRGRHRRKRADRERDRRYDGCGCLCGNQQRRNGAGAVQPERNHQRAGCDHAFGQSTATTVTVITYDKAIYDLSGSPTGIPPDPDGTSTWASPTTTNIGSQSLPLTLTLTPWSMNVVMIH